MLFIPAGTFNYWNAWLFIGILFIPMFFAGIILMIVNPNLLKIRLNAKEEEQAQRQVILLSALMFVLGFIISGLNYRFGWIVLPAWISIVAAGIFLITYLMYAEVLRENAYLSRTIEVQKDQKVIDTGLYGIVRHPMYFVTLIMFLSIPFILGSVPSIVVFLMYPFFIVKRIANEEQVLLRDLPGYDKYIDKVPYRLIPYIW